jgi:hypothetical protein
MMWRSQNIWTYDALPETWPQKKMRSPKCTKAITHANACRKIRILLAKIGTIRTRVSEEVVT